MIAEKEDKFITNSLLTRDTRVLFSCLMTSSLSPETEIHGSYKQIRNKKHCCSILFPTSSLISSSFASSSTLRESDSNRANTGKGTRCLCVPLSCGKDRREKERRVSGHLRAQKGQEEEEEKRRGNVGKGRISWLNGIRVTLTLPPPSLKWAFPNSTHIFQSKSKKDRMRGMEK